MTESTEIQSIPLQTPWIGVDVDPEAATYIGVLEGTVSALCINEAKYRALLELLTGEPWEDTRIDFNGQALMQLAVSALVRQTGMGVAQAKILVAKRWDTRNLPKEVVIPQAVPMDVMSTSEPVPRSTTVSERFKAWKERQLKEAEDVAPQGNTTE